MVRGLYEAALGMNTAMRKLDVVSNNIANVDTVGFKKDTVITQSFSDELMKRLDDPSPDQILPEARIGKMSLGVTVDNVATKFSMGSFKVTNNDFDTCISGDGFYTVSYTDANGETSERYTRDGLFTTINNVLVSNDGNPILGENGIITLPEGQVTFSEDGSVYANGQYIDRLRIASFTDNATLRKFGNNLYTTTPQTVPKDFDGQILQGVAEASNVNSVSEMVDMIVTNRWYEANQRVITTIDNTLQLSVNNISKA